MTEDEARDADRVADSSGLAREPGGEARDRQRKLAAVRFSWTRWRVLSSSTKPGAIGMATFVEMLKGA